MRIVIEKKKLNKTLFKTKKKDNKYKKFSNILYKCIIVTDRNENEKLT
jgi:hypothetical protein